VNERSVNERSVNERSVNERSVKRRGAVGLLAAFVALGATARLPAQEGPAREALGDAIAIDDPSGHALDALHAALRRARDGRGHARVLVWGASHVASDQTTGFLREEWQRRFGDAGPGLVLPARPFPLYDHRQVRIAERGSWRAASVHGRDRRAAAYGPAGFALDGDAGARASAALTPGAAPVDTVRVFSDGDPLELRLGEEGTSTEAGGSQISFRPSGGARRVELRAHGPVRLFGLSLERDRPGVIVDAVGVPGARIRDRLPWRDDPLREQLAALAPSLIVLAYGTNESGMTGRSLAIYRREVEEAVTRARAVAPDAGCLLVGPSDWPVRGPDGWRPRPRTADVIAIQRAIAHRHGCGFFDLVAFQGGPGSMPRWVDAGLALSDYVHFTDDGHRILARVLSRALLSGL
jgi:lysophospholipase L1-like esterase